MTHVLFCYLSGREPKRALIELALREWAKEHPSEGAGDTPGYPRVHVSPLPKEHTPEDCAALAGRFDAVIVSEHVDDRKRTLDDRAALLVRDALVVGKECWVLRDDTGEQSGLHRIADLAQDDAGQSRVLVRRNQRRKQP